MTATPGGIWHSKCGTIELRRGRWQEVLADVERCDAVICDPPYGETTHRGNDDMRERFGFAARQDIGYQSMTVDQVAEFIGSWSPRCSGWVCAMTSDDLIALYRQASDNQGRFAFSPVVIRQPRVRLGGDGPASEAVYLMVSRPRERRFLSWGALPGWYEAGVERVPGVNGAKPLWLMRSIVCDYSRPGDLIVDPFAGSGTTLLAAAIEGRRAIGAEMDPKTFALAVRRLERGWTPAMRFDVGREMKQGGLL